MATGLEVYDALKREIANFPHGTPWVLHRFDFTDLRKLTVIDLESRDYDRSVAVAVVRELERGDIAEFSKSVGLRLTVSSLGRPLLETHPIRSDRAQHLRLELSKQHGNASLMALFKGYLPSTETPASDAAIVDAILQVEYGYDSSID